MAHLGPLSEIVCVRGESFVVSGPGGDIVPGHDHGLYVRDTRFLSCLELYVDGERPVHLSGASVDGSRAAFHAYVPPSRDTEVDPAVSITRRRTVAGGLREVIELHNAGAEALEMSVALRVAADFAYIFDVKHGHVLDEVAPEPAGDTIGFRREGGEERSAATVPGAVAEGDLLTTRLRLSAGETRTVVLEVAASDLHGDNGPHRSAPWLPLSTRSPARRRRGRCCGARTGGSGGSCGAPSST